MTRWLRCLPGRLPLGASLASRWPAFVAACGAALLFTLYVVSNDWGRGLVSPYPFSDATLYHHYAWMLAFVSDRGGTLADAVPPSPYPLLLMAAYRSIGPGLLAPIVVNGILLTVTAGAISAATQRLWGHPEALIAGLFVALGGPMLFYAGLGMKTSSTLCFLALAAHVLTAWLDEPRAWRLALLAVATALLAMERGNFLLAAPAVVALPWLTQRSAPWPRRVTLSGLALTALATPAVLVSLALPSAPMHSPAALNFYIGNSQIATGTYVRVPGIRDDLLGHHLNPRPPSASGEAAQSGWLQRAGHDIAAEPGGFVATLGRKAALTAARYAPGSPEQFALWRWRRPALAAGIVDHAVLLALALPGIWLVRGRLSGAHRALLWVTLVYTASMILFFVIERYRLPLQLLLVPFAAAGVVEASRRSRREIVVLSLVMASIFAASHAATMLNPVGPGWTDTPTAKRAREARLQKRRLMILDTKTEAVRRDAARDWQRLAFVYRRHGMAADAELLADRAVARGQPSRSRP